MLDFYIENGSSIQMKMGMVLQL